MSDVLTHGYCALNGLDKIKSKALVDIINNNLSIYLLGAQGPDIFFYYKKWPWMNGENVHAYADILHKKETQAFFIKGCHYLSKIKRIDDYQAMVAYLCGFLSHYALDQISHPYIFYFSGVYDQNREESSRYQYEHKLFESSLDTLLAREFSASSRHYKTQSRIIKQTKTLPNCFDDFFRYLFKELYDVEMIEGAPSRAGKDMYNILKFMYDPFCIKRPLVLLAEKIMKKPLAFSTALFPSIILKRIDYFNFDKKRWLHPCDNSITSNKSFIDLLHDAERETGKYIDNFYDYCNGDLQLQMLKQIIPNNSYDTGQPLENRRILKYYHSIYDNRSQLE